MNMWLWLCAVKDLARVGDVADLSVDGSTRLAVPYLQRARPPVRLALAREADPFQSVRLGRATRHPRCDLSPRAETQFGQDAFDVAVGCAFGDN